MTIYYVLLAYFIVGILASGMVYSRNPDVPPVVVTILWPCIIVVLIFWLGEKLGKHFFG